MKKTANTNKNLLTKYLVTRILIATAISVILYMAIYLCFVTKGFIPSGNDVKEKLKAIQSYKNGWNMIRSEYITLKNSNKDNNKRSFVLYLESVNNVYNYLPYYE